MKKLTANLPGTTFGRKYVMGGMGKNSQLAQSDCGRDYSQGTDLCLNEGDEVADCK